MASTNDESLESAQLSEIRRQLHAPDVSPNDQSTVQESHAALSEGALPTATRHDAIEDPDSLSPTFLRGAAARRVSGKRRVNAAPLALTKSSPLISHQRSHDTSDFTAGMAHSFAGFDDDGDTQPLDTQVYRQYASSAVKQSFARPDAAESQGTAARVDLASEWDKPDEVEDEVSIADGDMSELSPATQSVVRNATGVAFAVPKTPALAGRKRDHRGEILDSVARTSELKTSSTKTPGTDLSAGVFGNANANNLISLTQAFNQTQAPSSPLPNGPRSDPIFERPSPNFQPPRATSPIPRTSSPTRQVRSDVSRAVTEPVEQYRTMQESQEERMRRRREEQTRHGERTSDILDEDDDMFNMPTIVEKRAERLRGYASNSSDAVDRSAAFNGRRTKPPSRSKDTRKMHVSDFGVTSDVQEVQIPMTSSKPGLKADGTTIVRSSPLGRLSSAPQEVPATASQPEKRAAAAPKATQATAIEDSQKERTESQKENDDPELLADGSVQGDHAMSQRSNFALSQLAAGSVQANTASKEDSRMTVDEPSTDHLDTFAGHHEGAVDYSAREMPSSPPMMTSDSRDEDESEGGVVRQDRTTARSPTPGHRSTKNQAAVGASTANKGLSANNASETQPQSHHTTTTNTNTTSLAFQTAPSHLSQSPVKHSATQNTAATGPTPRSLRTRKLTDIASDPTPRPSYEQMDLGSINIMNDDDEDFARIMSGSSPVRPTRKKRIVYSTKKQHPVALPVQPKTPPSAKKQNDAATHKPASPAVEPNSPPTSPTREPEREEDLLASKGHDTTTAGQNPPGPNATGKLKRPTRKASAKGSRSTRNNASVNEGSAEANDEATSADVAHQATNENDEMDDAVNVAPEQPVINTTVVASHGANRVIALCHDGKFSYWPATCTGIKSDGQYAIRFDDGTEDVVAEQHVRRFDLRPGDLVKIDLPAMKKREYIIQSVTTTTITVSAKPSGKGAMAGKATPATPITIPIGQAFLTGRLWPQLDGRKYSYAASPIDGAPSSTPAPMPAPSTVPTPASRSRRATTITLKTDQQRDVSAPSFGTESLLFQNMAFAISFKDDTSSERKSTLRSLVENGAQLLDDGFESLFEVPNVAIADSNVSNAGDGLHLTRKAASLGFVALITDIHSRRPKFLQALAVGLPCLHHRWVSDCIEVKKVLPWDRYLLPAGESTWLSGSVKSRTMQTYNPTEAMLANVIGNRARLIKPDSCASVLLVDTSVEQSNAVKSSGRTRKAVPARELDERRKRFVFMMNAVGLSHFRRVKDVAEANTVLDAGKPGDWAWVYVDGELRVAESLLSDSGAGQVAATNGRKRKRMESEEVTKAARAGVRVVNDEFIIQSLILGALAE